MIDIEIDKLTNSIVNRISGDSFSTVVLPMNEHDLKKIAKKNGWNFNWRSEAKQADRTIYKLTIVDNPDIVQGLMSISDFQDHFYLHLVENAPFNLGQEKLYEGVAGNLFAYAYKLSWDNGYQGFIAFQSKTQLITHYEKILNATHIGGHKMVVFPDAALKLILKYFQDE
jgi:hypothetical protein